MLQNMFDIFGISDVLRLKRGSTSIQTTNKVCCCLSYRVNGKSLFFYNGASLKIDRSHILFIPQNCTYSQQTEAEEVVCFHLESYHNILSRLTLFPCKSPALMCLLFNHAEQIWTEKEPNYYYRCLSVLYQILSLCNTALPVACNSEERKLEPAIQYLTANLFNPDLSVEDLFCKTNVSRSHFNKLFKTLYGMSPRKYIYSERIRKAKQLLKIGIYTNVEIASLCGFEDVKYFYVVFKRLTGKTTKQYKNTPI